MRGHDGPLLDQYSSSFALGVVAGSACLGMLIPPSILMIIWAVLTEISIGALFTAGIVPGLLLSLFFIRDRHLMIWTVPPLDVTSTDATR